MLTPTKIFTDKTGTGNSSKWCAQWYPFTRVHLTYAGGTTCTCHLEGSIDGVTWETVDAGGDNPPTLKCAEWWLYFRVVITVNDRTVQAIAGSGGA